MKITVYIFIFLGLIFLSGCQLFEDSTQLQEKKQELALKKLAADQEKELATIQMQMSLAAIEKEKALELQKMQNELKTKELSVNSEKELELIKQKIALQESNNSLAFEMYLFVFLAILLIVVAFFFFYYLKRKREDELLRYNDNLKKYFYLKENESRLKIAEKILDTIAQGELSKENEQKLINTLSRETSPLQDNRPHFTEETENLQTAIAALENTQYDNDAEIVEPITPETSASQNA